MTERAPRAPSARRGSTSPLSGNRAYRRLWLAVAISGTGDWLLLIALPLYVLQSSGSALATSTVFLVELVPAVIVGTVCGGVIDRSDTGRLLMALTYAQAALLLPLLLLGPERLWIVYVVAGAEAAITSITMPAQQSTIPDLVPPAELSRANAFAHLAADTARLAGSPLGGLLLPLLGLKALVLGDAATFLMAGWLLGGCRRAAHGSDTLRRPAAAPGHLRGIADGWRAIARSRTLACALAISCLAAVAQGLFLVLFVLFVLHAMHAGDQAVGLLRGVQAIGGVLGGLLVGAWAKRLGVRALATGGLALFGAISLLTWNSPAITTAVGWYAGLFIAVGLPSAALMTGLLTGAQSASPRNVAGRVLSLIQVAEALGQGAGILAAGLLAGTVSLTVLLDIQGSLYLVCAVLAGAGFRPAASRTGTAYTAGGLS